MARYLAASCWRIQVEMNSYKGDETVDTKPDNIQQLRSVSELVRDRFERDRNADALREVIERGPVVPLMRKAIADTLARVRSRYLVESDDNGLITVVHYTRIEVVIGMFQARIEKKPSYLRMYDTFHSNDPDEGKYLVNRLDPLTSKDLTEELGDAPACAYVTSFIRPEPKPKTDIRNVSDNLVFWQIYGDRGTGCSLTVKMPASGLFKVSYGRKAAKDAGRYALTAAKEVRALIEGSLKPILDIPDGSIQTILTGLRESLVSELREAISSIFYLHKSGAYEYEREVRAVGTIPVIGRDQIKFEYSNDSGEIDVRHYYECNDLCVKRLLNSNSIITIGPCVQNRENVAYYLEHLMRKANLWGPQIVQSRVSYRNS